MPEISTPPKSTAEAQGSASGRWKSAGGLLVFAAALAVLLPTAGDYGVTWDEPAYRYSQVISAQWWRQWLEVRSWKDVEEQLDPNALLYYWPYARFGINFHPPLAGQVSLAGNALAGGWMKDYPSRRLGSIFAFALTAAIGFQFLSRRYGSLAGLGGAASLLLMPRLYGQAHLLDTDIPGLLIWVAAALAFWKGLYEPNARRWRIVVGVLMGLAFLEKMAAVGVLLPLLLWLMIAFLPSAFSRKAGKAAWIDAAATLIPMLLPLGLAFIEIQMLQRRLPPPAETDLFFQSSPRPQTSIPGLILAIPLLVWIVRRLLARFRPKSKVWGVERPALETLAAILAFAPVVGWLGNPSWWFETIVRMTHYYTLSNDRQGALPDIRILYAGQIYKYSLPWHNGWLLTAITVPPTILLAAAAGIYGGLRRTWTDRIPLYFILHMITLPSLRMFHTPAHDGVRLLLPTFFFLAAFAGGGIAWFGESLIRRIRGGRGLALAVVLLPALVSLVRIHPYELSYYNVFVGGPSGAWRRGFELTYWYDAFTPDVIADLNQKLPEEAELDFLNRWTTSSMHVFSDLQQLGHLRADLKLGRRSGERFPFVMLLTQDSKSTPFTRLLFGMKPWYSSEPSQLGGLRVLTVADPTAVSRAWALSLLVEPPTVPRASPWTAPGWVRDYAPFLKRLWGEGLQLDPPLGVHERIVDWARNDPQGLKAAADKIAGRQSLDGDPQAQRLANLLVPEIDGRPSSVSRNLLDQVLAARPQALVEAVDILNAHPDAVVEILRCYPYTDPAVVGGYLDRDLTAETPTAP